jgi:hypothetical protein
MDAGEPCMQNRLLILHHELLYPAFAGAALFEFAKKVAEVGIAQVESLWFFSALWFLLYFSVAFLALAAAQKREDETGKQQFGIASFFANLVEIGVILYTTVGLEVTNTHTQAQELNYTLVYVAWMAIPATAAISNFCSGRAVHTVLSVCAFAVGAVGFFWVKEAAYGYSVLLFIMYLLLLGYYCVVFSRCSVNLLNLDIPARDAS